MAKTTPEIMSPAGSFAALQSAINAGCDSVYFGVQQLNMRARSAANFTLEDLKEIAKTCKEAKIKAYLTINTLLYEHDLTLMRAIINTAKEAGVNAIIAQDISAIQYANEVGISVHASTTLSISNYESVKFYAKFADTIVLARELDLKMIRSICEKIQKDQLKGPKGELIKIETFVHGALCIAQSGRCQMSLLSNNTSAQRGACLQECRKKYKIIDEDSGTEMVVDDAYILSPKDLCCLPFLDQLADAGIAVFKIEGRGRSAQYVDVVTRVYRKAADAIAEGTFDKKLVDEGMEQLKTVYNRGFSDGYYMGKPLPEWSGYGGNRSTDERTYVGLVKHYFDKAKVVELNIQAHEIKKGDRLVVMGKTTGTAYETVKEILRDDVSLEKTERKDTVTIPFSTKLRHNDKIYLLRSRDPKTIPSDY